MRCLIMVPAISAGTAAADCTPEQEPFMSCQIEGRNMVLSVCLTADLALYSYGPQAGPPDLTLSEPLVSVAYTPWPGVGRSIWEDVTFINGEYRYTVFAGFDRMFGNETEADHPTPHFGGVTVRQGDVQVAELACDRATVNYGAFGGDPIYEAKIAAGQQWDGREQVWRAARQ